MLNLTCLLDLFRHDPVVAHVHEVRRARRDVGDAGPGEVHRLDEAEIRVWIRLAAVLAMEKQQLIHPGAAERRVVGGAVQEGVADSAATGANADHLRVRGSARAVGVIALVLGGRSTQGSQGGRGSRGGCGGGCGGGSIAGAVCRGGRARGEGE